MFERSYRLHGGFDRKMKFDKKKHAKRAYFARVKATTVTTFKKKNTKNMWLGMCIAGLTSSRTNVSQRMDTLHKTTAGKFIFAKIMDFETFFLFVGTHTIF